ncbi:hypothetical protein [Sessilibacter sp. MAH4]
MLIAGKNGVGKPVNLSPNNKQLINAFTGLKICADRNESWAVNAIRELKSLNSGHFKNSVYVDVSVKKATVLTLVLPGVRASVLKKKDGSYIIFQLKIDDTYLDLQKSFEKPSLVKVKYNASKRSPWYVDAKSKTNTTLKRSRLTKVVVSDSRKSPAESAAESADALKSSSLASEMDMKTHGFFMHFTPGDKSIGGFKHWTQAYNVDSDKSLRESSKMLADTMLATKEIEGMSWVSEAGGSGILAQALKILDDKGVTFDKCKHHIFFHGMTTNQKMAENYALKMKFMVDRKISSGVNLLNINQLFGSGAIGGGQFVAAVNRYRQDPEHTILKLGADVAEAATGARGAGATIATSAGACLAALGISVSTQGDFSFSPLVIASMAAASAAYPLGKKLTEAWAPRLARKIKSKF